MKFAAFREGGGVGTKCVSRTLVAISAPTLPSQIVRLPAVFMLTCVLLCQQVNKKKPIRRFPHGSERRHRYVLVGVRQFAPPPPSVRPK